MPTIPGTPILYTVQEVADSLRVHKRTAYNLIKNGELKAVKIGTQWRVPEGALFEFIERGGQRPTGRKKRRSGPEQLKLPLDLSGEREEPDDEA